MATVQVPIYLETARPPSASTAAESPDAKQDNKLKIPLLYGPSNTKVKSTQETLTQVRERNIKLMYLHITFMTLYQSICCWNVFDAYLAILAREQGSQRANTWVGAAESVTGLSTLIFAIPCGILADKTDRTKIIRWAGVLGIFASFTSLLGFLLDNWKIIFMNMALWGLFTSCMGTAAEAVFADSCPAGNRSKQTAMKGSLQTVGLAAGPLIMWGVFKFLGDQWTISTLHVPLIIGCILGPIAAIPCFYMLDPRQLDISQGVQEVEKKVSEVRLHAESNLNLLRARGYTNATISEAGLETPVGNLAIASLARNRGDSRAVTDQVEEALRDQRLNTLVLCAEENFVEDQIVKEEKRFLKMTRSERAIPFILTTADFITEIGAGMTVRFFPLFFISDFGVKPTTMSLIFGIYPALVALSIHICQQVSVVTGRAQISWLFQLCGIFCLLGMVYIQNLPIIIAVFFARSCFQNAAYPVDRSILYDFIPSSQRGRWASIASLTTMTWSGSAVIGGIITDGHDYRYTFVITAIIYAVGLTVYTPLLWTVPKETNLLD